ncbi:MAG: bifunctional nicotinamidase/pyrazinamidase [Tatlockia sp.]|nr:bifunctional nicotinamidase/pyrazinamidase [Tatlockia sp.]
MKALIIIDAQNDFMPGGSLAVPEGDKIIPIINALQAKFDLVIATQDWHPENHQSFAANHPHSKPFDTIPLQGLEQTLWPTHCVQGRIGAELHGQIDKRPIAAIFRKGMDAQIDSYSAFYDNNHLKNTGVAGFLHAKKIEKLYFSGLCADICVYYSIQDALAEGFSCILIEDATCPLDRENYKALREKMLEQGVEILNSWQIF